MVKSTNKMRNLRTINLFLTLYYSLFCTCVFVPPPPLPEELTTTNTKKQEPSSPVAKNTTAEKPQQEQSSSTFTEGQIAPGGMSEEEIREYRVAQGDPISGDFTLDQALEGLSGEGTLWAEISTSRGTIDCQLLKDEAPLTVANFVGLARGTRPFRDPKDQSWKSAPYFNGTIFHRVIPGFIIQGGDPTGTGLGNPGYVIIDEFSSNFTHSRAGILSMANRQEANTGSGQFFITLNPTSQLDGVHTVFGLCSEQGTSLADDIAMVPRDGNDKPVEPEVIEQVKIVYRPLSADLRSQERDE